MTNTPFSKRVEILGDYYANMCEDVGTMSSALMQDHRDTFWICLAANVKYVSIEPRFHSFVNDAWDVFCEHLGIDKYGDFDSLDNLIDLVNAEG